MKLYEINAKMQELLDAVDPDTGEIIMDWDAFNALSIAREEKLEGVALAVKNYTAEAVAIREEEKKLAERRSAIERRAERAKQFLEGMLNGEELKTPRVVVSYRKSESVMLTSDFLSWAMETGDFLRFKEPEPDKAALRRALKAGEEIPGAELVQNVTMIIK